jgi:hypothetical protein
MFQLIVSISLAAQTINPKSVLMQNKNTSSVLKMYFYLAHHDRGSYNRDKARPTARRVGELLNAVP